MTILPANATIVVPAQRAAYRTIATWARTTAAHGSYMVMWVILAFALMMCGGLIYDGGQKVHAHQYANHIAEEAARTAGQQLVRPLGMRGIATVSDPVTAQLAAQAYLLQFPDVQGVVIPAGPTSLAVVVTTIWKPTILALFGAHPQPMVGKAIITLNRTNNGAGLP